jgi:predicted phosphohydrolase
MHDLKIGCDILALYAISDPHLSLSSNKPMDVFGEMWADHHLKLQHNWNQKVCPEDTVLVAGDISWAMKLEDAIVDLDFIHRLNGKKVFIKGNHDYWWNSITRLNSLYDDMVFLQNTFYPYEDYGICGTRGWASIDGTEEHDEKIYKRELMRLEASIKSAQKEGYEKLIIMMHYPPATRISRSSEFLELLDNYNVEMLIYGHVHYDAKEICINGNFNNMKYICTSADIIGFDPVRLL